MARYTKQNVNSVPSINAELTKIQTAINDTLSRKGDAPNQMEANLDMNSNRILNLPEPVSDHEPARLADLKAAGVGGGSGGTNDHSLLVNRDAPNQHPMSAINGLELTIAGIFSTVGTKQDELVSGVNIKTINNQSLLGSGNIDVSGGGGSSPSTYFQDIAQLRATAGVTNGQLVNVISYHSGWAAANLPPTGGGDFYWDTLSTAPDDNVSVYGSFPVGRWIRRGVNEVIDITWAGAKPDNTYDCTQAIRDCIAYAKKANSRGRVIFIPAGVYRTTDEIVIDVSGVVVRGVYEKGLVAGTGSYDYAGSHINYQGTTPNKAILKFDKGDNTGNFHSRVENLRVGSTASLANKPKAGIEMRITSEGTIENVHINSGCQVGLLLDTCTIMRIENLDIAFNDIGIRFVNTASFGTISGNGSVWLSKLNIWECSQSGIQIETDLRSIHVRDCWIEYCQNSVHFIQPTNTFIGIGQVLFDGVQISNGDPNRSNTRSFRFTAFQGGNQSFFIESITFRNVEMYDRLSSHNFEFTRGTNTGGLTYIGTATFYDCDWFGAQTSAVVADTANAAFYFHGKQQARTTYSGSTSVALTSGTLRRFDMLASFQYWDMSAGRPIKLPQTAPTSFTDPGQLIYSTSQKLLRFTDDSGTLRTIPRQAIAQAGSTATTVAGIVADFNTLVAKLRDAGVIAT